MNSDTLPETFEEAFVRIMSSRDPMDLFGRFLVDADNQIEIQKDIDRIFRKLAMLVHPDKNQTEEKRAGLAFRRLEKLRDLTERNSSKTETENFSKVFSPISFTTKKYSYTIVSRLVSGGTCDIFNGRVIDKRGGEAVVLVKVPRSVSDNDLMNREVRAYEDFKRKAKEIAVDTSGEKLAEAFLRHFPTRFDSIELEEPGCTQKKMVNIFALHPDFIDGWYSLAEIRKEYPQGIGTRPMAFIWNRILEGLMFAHCAGIIHSALTPNHVLIHAKTHMGNIIDWTASCKIGKTEHVPYIDDQYRQFFPPEVLDPKGIPTPETDIYMSAWCMVYLLGGDPATQEIPKSVESPIMELLNTCLQPNRRLRPHSAEDVFKKFKEVCKQLWGDRKFVELKMP